MGFQMEGDWRHLWTSSFLVDVRFLCWFYKVFPQLLAFDGRFGRIAELHLGICRCSDPRRGDECGGKENRTAGDEKPAVRLLQTSLSGCEDWAEDGSGAQKIDFFRDDLFYFFVNRIIDSCNH